MNPVRNSKNKYSSDNFKLSKNQGKISNRANEPKTPQLKVCLFTTPACPYCIALKEFLKTHNIEFEDIDVSQDEKAQKEMIEKSGQMGVPIVEIDGQVIIGFDREKITKLLNIHD